MHLWCDNPAFGWEKWRLYDIENRKQRCLGQVGQVWSLMNTEVFALASLAAPISTVASVTPPTAPRKAPAKRAAAATAARGSSRRGTDKKVPHQHRLPHREDSDNSGPTIGSCNRWNVGNCNRSIADCRFRHVCEVCGSNKHPATHPVTGSRCTAAGKVAGGNGGGGGGGGNKGL